NLDLNGRKITSSYATTTIEGGADNNILLDGNTYISGGLFDNTNSAGSAGMVLQSTGTSFAWVATSTLGITGGSGGGGTYTAGSHLTLTVSEFSVDDNFILNTGDAISCHLTFSGTAANIVLGSNWLSGDGD